VHLPPCGAHQVEPADRVAPSRGDKSRTDTQDAQGLCVAAHDSVPLHALKANNVGSVEKPADEEPTGRRFLEWVVRHAGRARSESIQPVAKTPGYCWSSPKCRNCASHMLSLKAQKSRESNAVTVAVSRGNRMTNSIRAFCWWGCGGVSPSERGIDLMYNQASK